MVFYRKNCLNPEQVVHEWIEEYNLKNDTIDVTKVDIKFTDKVPTDIQMGKVYARLVLSIATNGDLVDGIQKVYASPICEYIDNYNSSAYYEPSYVQTQAFNNGYF